MALAPEPPCGAWAPHIFTFDHTYSCHDGNCKIPHCHLNLHSSNHISEWVYYTVGLSDFLIQKLFLPFVYLCWGFLVCKSFLHFLGINPISFRHRNYVIHQLLILFMVFFLIKLINVLPYSFVSLTFYFRSIFYPVSEKHFLSFSFINVFSFTLPHVDLLSPESVATLVCN